jgi:hypothetical protein
METNTPDGSGPRRGPSTAATIDKKQGFYERFDSAPCTCSNSTTISVAVKHKSFALGIRQMKISAIAFVLTLVATLTTDVVAAPVENEFERGQEEMANAAEGGLNEMATEELFGAYHFILCEHDDWFDLPAETSGMDSETEVIEFKQGSNVDEMVSLYGQAKNLSASVQWDDLQEIDSAELLFELMGLGLSWDQAVALLAQ